MIPGNQPKSSSQFLTSRQISRHDQRCTARKWRTGFVGVALALAMVLGITTPHAQAQLVTREWVNPATGEWNNPVNWLPQFVPGSNDLVLIGNGGNAQISNGSNAFANFIFVGEVNNQGAGTSGAITILNGTLNVEDMEIGSFNASGVVEVRGPNSRVNSTGYTLTGSDNGLFGRLVISEGAFYNHTGDGSFTGDFALGSDAVGVTPGSGEVIVTGSGTRLLANRIVIGFFSQDVSAFTASDNALVEDTNSEGSVIGNIGVASTGFLTVESNATFSTNKITGGDGSANLTLNGGTLQARSNQDDFISNFNIPDRAVFIDEDGATFDTNGFDVTVQANAFGTGQLAKTGQGALTIAGGFSNTGQVFVNEGSLLVTGNLVTGPVLVRNGSTIGGTGNIEARTTINDGRLAPGTSAGTLNIDGQLILNQNSILDYELDQPNVVGNDVNDLTVVAGNLTLNGTLNIIDLGNFGEGTYRLFNYGGSLTNNGLDIGTIPTTGTFEVSLDFSTANQVNLTVIELVELYWDGVNTTGNGTIDGGTGTWNSTTTNWTLRNGNNNQAWEDALPAVFAGTSGTVTIANGFTPKPSGVRFEVDGYTIAATGSGGISLTDAVPFSVVNQNDTATISAPIIGAGTFQKTGAGTVTLTGMNSYSGNTRVANGTLIVDGGTITSPNATARVGNTGTANTRLVIQNAGFVSSQEAQVGLSSNSNANINIAGAGSIWNVNNTFVGGETGNANVNLSNGGTLQAAKVILGQDAGSVGKADAFGSGASLLSTGGNAIVGQDGTGSVSLRNGGQFLAPTVVLAQNSGSMGHVFIGASNASDIAGITSPGFINATAVDGRSGDAGVNLIHNSMSYHLTNDGTSGGTPVQLFGSLGLTATSGTTTVSGDNNFTGGTTVLGTTSTTLSGLTSDANLIAGHVNALGNGDVLLDGGNLILDTAGSPTFSNNIMANGTSQSTLTTRQNASHSGMLTSDSGARLTLESENGSTLTITGNNTAFDGTLVSNGMLQVDGTLNGGGTLSVANGSTLGGTGSVGLTTTIQNGGAVAPGASAGTLGFDNLILNTSSILNFELGSPSGPNDLINVGGDLTLDGILNVSDLGGFSVGTYRLINYSGNLTDDGIILNTIPAGAFDLTIDTNTMNQINLNVVTTVVLNWDGSNTTPNGIIDGGTGTWDSTMTNWTNDTGTVNDPWTDGARAIFGATAGVVTIADGFTPNPGRMNFQVDGYQIAAAGSGSLGLTGSVSIQIANASHTATISAPITGPGSFVKNGDGTLVLTANNSYNRTVITAGTVQIGNGGTMGTLGTGDVVNNGSLVFNRSDDFTFGNEIDGSGSVRIEGMGTVRFTGNNTYSGNTQVNNGDLIVNGGQINSPNATISVGGNTASDQELLVVNGGQVTAMDMHVAQATGTDAFLGVHGSGSQVNLSGMLGVGQAGSGEVEIVSGGQVMADSATFASGAGSSARVEVRGSGSKLSTDSGLIIGDQGMAMAQVANSGELASNSNVILGQSASGSGMLYVGAAPGDAAPLAPGRVNAPAVNGGAGTAMVIFNHTSDSHEFTSDGTSNGTQVDLTGNLAVQHDAGITALSGNNTYTQGTTINGGTLIFKNGSSAGTSGVALNGGTLGFDWDNGSGPFTFSNAIDVQTDSKLAVLADSTNPMNVASVITAPMGTNLNVSGPVEFSGDSTSTFMGNLTNEGVMTLSGGLRGMLMNNGTFMASTSNQGTGDFDNKGVVSVYEVDSNNKKTPSTLNVNGDFVNRSSGTYNVIYNPDDANFPNNPGVGNSLINATGTATLEAGSKIAVAGDPDEVVTTGEQMTVITAAGGVTDMGAEVSSSTPFIGWEGSIFGNNYILTAIRLTYTTGATTPNQTQVATGLDELADSPITPGSPSAELLSNLDTVPLAQFPATLDQLSPERYDSVNTSHTRTTQNLNNVRQNYLHNRRMGLPVNAAADTSTISMMFSGQDKNPAVMLLAMEDETDSEYASFRLAKDINFNAWAKGFYMRSDQSTDSDRTGYSANTGGGMVGFDAGILDNMLIGLSFAFTGTQLNYDGAGGNADIFGYRFGPYLSIEPIERLFIDFSVTYAFSTIDSERVTTTGLTPVTASANYSGHDISVYANVEYDLLPQREWYVAPLLGLNYIWYQQDAFTESGAGGANLSVDSQQTNSLDLRVGGRVAWMGKINELLFIAPEATLAYRRELLANSNSGIGARFVNAGGGFEIARGPFDENGVEVGLGVTFLIKKQLSIFTNYNGVFYSGDMNHYIGAGLNYSFK